MPDIETTRQLAYGATAVAGIIGGGLTVSVLFAATVPVHEPIRTTLARLCAQAVWALSVAYRAFLVAWVSSARYVKRYGYRGRPHPARGGRALRGQHRPEVVATWQAPPVYNVRQVPRDRWAALMIDVS